MINFLIYVGGATLSFLCFIGFCWVCNAVQEQIDR